MDGKEKRGGNYYLKPLKYYTIVILKSDLSD